MAKTLRQISVWAHGGCPAGGSGAAGPEPGRLPPSPGGSQRGPRPPPSSLPPPPARNARHGDSCRRGSALGFPSRGTGSILPFASGLCTPAAGALACRGQALTQPRRLCYPAGFLSRGLQPVESSDCLPPNPLNADYGRLCLRCQAAGAVGQSQLCAPTAPLVLGTGAMPRREGCKRRARNPFDFRPSAAPKRPDKVLTAYGALP